MQETEYKQDANTLHVRFQPSYSSQNELTSREFVLCGLVMVKLKTNLQYRFCTTNIFDFQIIYIKITKTFVSDQLPYMIEVSSDALQLRKHNIVADFESSKLCWYILYKKAKFEPQFDIKVILNIDTSPKTNTIFSLLYDDEDLTDFELRGEDGTVKVHKAVLAGNSPVMKTMLSGEWKEALTGAVKIPHTTKKTLQQLKDYMYLKKLPESGLEKLAALACCYMMADFEELCTLKLLLTLTKDNVEDLLDFAVKYRMKKFKIAIMLTLNKSVDVVDLLKKVNSEFEVQSKESSDEEQSKESSESK